MTIFLQWGSLGDRSEKGVIGCEIAQNLGNFNSVFFFFKFSLQFAKQFNLMIMPKILIEKVKIRGHWV